MNKFLITVIVPTIEMEFDIYIPNNKKIGTIKKYILKTVSELSQGMFSKTEENAVFIDKDTGDNYSNNLYVKDTKICNGTKIIIL